MKVTIIGAGNLGRALAKNLSRLGHEIIFGLRDLEKYQYSTLTAEIEAPIQLMKLREAAQVGEIIFLAVPGHVALEVAEELDYAAPKILVDCCNPMLAGQDALDQPLGESLTERLQFRLPHWRLVKTLNQTGAENLDHPVFKDGKAVMLIAGKDRAAKEEVSQILAALGFEVVDAGGLSETALLEQFALLWMHLAYRAGLGQGFAFGLLRHE